MPRWLCTSLAVASWPVAMTIGVFLISPPVLALYDAGQLGDSPSTPMTIIAVSSFALSLLLSLAIGGLLHAYCNYDEARQAREVRPGTEG